MRFEGESQMTGRVTIFVMAAVTWLVVGCGLEAGESVFDDQEIGAASGNSSQPPAQELGQGSGAGTMAGTWLKIHVASSCVLGQEQVTTAYYLVDITEEGAGLREEKRICELQMSPILGLRPIASSDVLESIEFPHIDWALMSSLVEGSTYSSSTEVGLWGLALDDPIRDAVPVDPEDERVIDGDGDGNPGVSLELEGMGCDRFMGQRQVVRYFGTLESPNDIRGTSTTITDIEVYGGTSSLCELAPDVESNDDHSFFRMVRVDGLGGSVNADADGDGNVTCEEAASLFEAIWEPREADDDHCE